MNVKCNRLKSPTYTLRLIQEVEIGQYRGAAGKIIFHMSWAVSNNMENKM